MDIIIPERAEMELGTASPDEARRGQAYAALAAEIRMDWEDASRTSGRRMRIGGDFLEPFILPIPKGIRWFGPVS